MNIIVITGRLTRDPELRYTQTQKAVCTFTVAVDRPRIPGRDKEADFVRVQAWEKTAENCDKFLTKGSPVIVRGELRINKYEKDGQTREAVTVRADRVEFTAPAKEKLDDFTEIQEELPF